MGWLASFFARAGRDSASAAEFVKRHNHAAHGHPERLHGHPHGRAHIPNRPSRPRAR